MLLSSPFPVLWPERTYLSWDFFFFLTVCNQCFYTHDFSSIQSGICEDKKKTQRTCHCVLPHIPRSLAGLPSLHISESSYILDTISRVFCYTLQEEQGNLCLFCLLRIRSLTIIFLNYQYSNYFFELPIYQIYQIDISLGVLTANKNHVIENYC